MSQGYYSAAWAAIKRTPGWFGNLLLLSLLLIVPVFGPMVLYGYLYGWAREVAWRVDAPLPKRIFNNDDNKFYRRGFFALVIALVFGIIPAILMNVSSLSGSASYSAISVGALVSACVVSIVGIVLALVLTPLSWVGIMRMTLYNRLSAGFQLSKIWKMARHDMRGLARILGMNILASVIVGIVFFVLFALVMGAFVIILALAQHALSIVAIFGVMILFFACVVISYFAVVGAVFVSMLTAHAMGSWTAQFDVALWRGQDDPMPFEWAPEQPNL